MKIIIAPAKKMVVDSDTFDTQGFPDYLDQTKHLLTRLRQLSYNEAKQLWHCSDKLAQPNYAWLQKLDLTRHLTPAILSYSGIQYQYMAPDLLTDAGLAYIQQNLRILSGFYGILRPFDGIVPYRLEMQSKLTVGTSQNLYDFWGDRLYQALAAPTEPILNLASQEYTKSIRPYLNAPQPFVTVVFASLINGQLKTKATLAKMARGAMVRFLAKNQITELSQLKYFDHPHYQFDDQRSTATKLVFIHID